MKKFGQYLKKYGVRMAIVVVLVAFIAGFIGSRSGNGASAVENAAGALTVPVKSASTGIVGWLESIYGYMFRYDQLEAENKELSDKVTELENQLREAKEMERENEHYRELLGFQDKQSDFVFESAKVVDRGSSNWNTTLTLSKGEESGIEMGDCVVDSANNLVGQVIEVGSGWSTVRSVIDTDMKVGVLVGEGGAAAMVVGDFALMQNGQTKLSYLTGGTQVFVDDVLLTSGRGGVFPKNLVIGTVSEVHTEAGGQVEYATVTPAVDPDTLTLVFVVKDFNVVE